MENRQFLCRYFHLKKIDLDDTMKVNPYCERIRLWDAMEVGAPQFWLNVCRHLQKRQLGEEVSSDFGVLAWRKWEMDSWVVQMFTPHCPSVWWEASCSSQPHLLTPQWTNFDLRQYFHHKQIFSETWYQTWNYLTHYTTLAE